MRTKLLIGIAIASAFLLAGCAAGMGEDGKSVYVGPLAEPTPAPTATPAPTTAPQVIIIQQPAPVSNQPDTATVLFLALLLFVCGCIVTYGFMSMLNRARSALSAPAQFNRVETPTYLPPYPDGTVLIDVRRNDPEYVITVPPNTHPNDYKHIVARELQTTPSDAQARLKSGSVEVKTRTNQLGPGRS